jgi:D-xylose transport system substrate-binding protein
MRTLLLIAFTSFFTVSFFTSCNKQDKVSVGISIGPFHERWEKDRDYMVEYFKTINADYIVREAGNDANTQFQQVQSMLKKGIDVLVMVPVNSNTAHVIVEKAQQEGVKVIAYDRLIKDCNLDFYLSFDNVKVGQLQADYLTRIKPEGKYIILGGSPDDYNSMLVRLGQMIILEPLITRGDVEIVLDRNVPKWDPENAFRIMQAFLRDHEAPDAVVAANDGIAAGVCRALEEHGVAGEVLVSGQDARTDACRRIHEGVQTMTVYKYLRALAHVAVQTTVALAGDEVVPFAQSTVNNGQEMVPAILLPSMIQVTKENMEATVIADGFVSEQEIYAP